MMRAIPWIAASTRNPNEPRPKTRFDPIVLLTNPKNWQVWRQFLEFSAAILILPLVTFAISEYLLRLFFALTPQQSQGIGGIFAIVIVQILIYYYAVLAVKEETKDYNEEVLQKQTHTERETNDTNETNTDKTIMPSQDDDNDDDSTKKGLRDRQSSTRTTTKSTTTNSTTTKSTSEH